MAAFLIACALTMAQPPGPHAAEGARVPAPVAVPDRRPAYRVLRAVDGQTLVVSQWGWTTKVRLIGVAPLQVGGDKKASDTFASRSLTRLFGGRTVHLRYEGNPPLDG